MIHSIATYLSRFPALKRLAKFTFQSVNYLLHFHLQKVNCRFPVEQISGSNGGCFGYYDKSPESPDGKWIIFHELTPGWRNDGVSIVLKSNEDNHTRIIGRTQAFNLQAGSRLQWISRHRFVYNIYDTVNNLYGSVWYDVDSNEQGRVPETVYDTRNDEFLTVDYKNLAACQSEYGYTAHGNTSERVLPRITRGVFSSESSEVLIDVDKVKELVPEAFAGSRHLHFNHVMYNPSGTAFVFIMRWTGPVGRKEALLHYEFTTSNIRLISSEMTSHYCWVDDTTLFGYMSHDSVKGYYNVTVNDHSFRYISNPRLKGDGHPSFRNGIYLTDTYPDSARMQQLLLIHERNVLHAGSFYSPLIYHEAERCDLHPRFNYPGNRIYFDSMHSGTRHLYRINFNQS